MHYKAGIRLALKPGIAIWGSGGDRCRIFITSVDSFERVFLRRLEDEALFDGYITCFFL